MNLIQKLCDRMAEKRVISIQATILAKLLQKGHAEYPTVNISGTFSKSGSNMSILFFALKISLSVCLRN
jgi:hypothetical protein